MRNLTCLSVVWYSTLVWPDVLTKGLGFLSVAGQLRCSQDYEMPRGWVGIKEILTWANLLNLAKNN